LSDTYDSNQKFELLTPANSGQLRGWPGPPNPPEGELDLPLQHTDAISRVLPVSNGW